MKKLFVSVLAIAAAVACNTAEIVDLPQNPQINFANAFVQNATRADVAADPSTKTADLASFNVWGFMNEPAGQVFVEELVTKSGDAWGYTNTQYWVKGHTYYFAALANYTNAIVDTAGANTYGLGTVTFDNAAAKGAEDLLYAATSVDAQNAIPESPVALTFSHLLSKVKFSFINGFTNELATIDVKNVQITNAPAVGTINLAVENWWDNDDWTVSGSTTLNFGDVCEKLAINGKQECANECLTIPAAQDYTIEFDVVYYQGSVAASEAHKVVTLKGVEFEMGKAYNLSAVIDASNVSQDGEELKPIEFTVVEVKDWITATTPDAQIEDAEFRAAAQLGGVVTLNKDVVLSSTLALANDLVLDLNGHNITINNDSDELGVGDGIIVTEGTLTIKGEGTVTANTRAIWARGNGGAVINIEGGNYVGATKGNTCEVIYASGNGIINIYGGTFEAETEDNVSFAAPQYAVLNLHGNGATGCNITVYGGSFKNFNPADNISENPKKNFCADGYFAVANGEWYNVIEGAVAVATAAELQDALNSGAPVICLSGDVDYGTVTLGELKNVTIYGAANAPVMINTDANTKLENVTLSGINFVYNGSNTNCGVVINKDAQIDNLVLDGCSVVGIGAKAGRGIHGQNPNATIVVKNCVFENLGYPIYTTAAGGYKALTIENCTFNLIKSWAIMPQYGEYLGDLTVTGCTFENCTGGLVKAGKFTSGHTFAFTNNTITNSAEHPAKNWFTIDTSAATAVVSGNVKDGAAWTPGTAEGLK